MKSLTETSKAILSRHQLAGFGIEISGNKCELSAHEIDNPYQPVNAPHLVAFLFLANERKGWKPPRPFRSYLRPAKQFIEKVGPEVAEVSVRKAANYAKHPFGMDFVVKVSEE